MRRIMGCAVTVIVIPSLLLSGISCSKPSTETPAPTSQPTTTPELTKEEPAPTLPSESIKEEEEPEPALPPMKTFTSEFFGVSIDYPESYEAEQESYQNIPFGISINHPALIVQLTISTYDEEFQQRHKLFTPEDAVNWFLALGDASDRRLISKPTRTTVGGFPASTVSFIKPSNGHYYRYISTKKGSLIFYVWGVTQDPLYRPEIDAMLDSFRFTDN